MIHNFMEQLLWVDSCHSHPPLHPWAHLLTFYFLNFSVGCSNQPTYRGLTLLNSSIKNLGGKYMAKESKTLILNSLSVISGGKFRFEMSFVWFGTISTAHSIHKQR